MDTSLVTALDAGDVDAASRWIETESDPMRVVAMYHGAMRHLYWSLKDVPRLVQLARRAISFALRTASASSGETATRLRLGAKVMAYDLGSFTWPGWDEPGAVIGDADRAAGAEAAALSLRLASELDRGDAALANAHWLMGAHAMSAGDAEAAAAAFDAAAGHARTAGDGALESMARAFGLAAAGASADELRAATSDLASSEDGAEYAAQVRTALRVFGRPLD